MTCRSASVCVCGYLHVLIVRCSFDGESSSFNFGSDNSCSLLIYFAVANFMVCSINTTEGKTFVNLSIFIYLCFLLVSPSWCFFCKYF